MKAMTRLIKSLKIEDNVRLIGKKRQNEVIKILHQSHILVAPSVTGSDGDQEGIPVSIMEAMATGMPVVSTQHSGINELVEDNITGFLVPERDIDSLADKISYLISQPETCLEMGLEARARIEQNFNTDTLNNRLVSIFEEQLVRA